jgi:hypothetical protein
MANATAITINDAGANAAIADPTADTLDTGTSAVTISAAINSQDHRRVIVKVQNQDGTNALTALVKAGATNPPAFRAGVGDLSTTVALSSTKWIGPFDPSRFAQSDGSLKITFTPAAGTINAKVTLFRLAKHA